MTANTRFPNNVGPEKLRPTKACGRKLDRAGSCPQFRRLCAQSGNPEPTPGNSTRLSGDSTRDPGDSTRYPGNSTRDPGDSTRDPGNSTRASGDPTRDPGNSTRDPGDPTRYPGEPTRGSGDPEHGSGGSETSARFVKRRSMNDLRVIDRPQASGRLVNLLASRPGSRLFHIRKNVGNTAFEAGHDLVQTSQRNALLALFEPVKR